MQIFKCLRDSSRVPPTSASKSYTANMAKMEAKAEELYERALGAAGRTSEGTQKIFRQDELIELGELGSKDDLLPLCNQLSENILARFHQVAGEIAFSFRTKTVADK